MNRQVIHIYGASGAGVTTLGRYISQRTGFTQLDTDDYFWLPTDPPFTMKRETEERVRLMRERMADGSAVISGSLTGWGDVLTDSFTLAIRLETDSSLRLKRLREREYSRFGSRIEEGGDMYKEHVEFINWAAQYDTGGVDMRSRACHDEWEKLLKCPIIRLCGSDSPEHNYEIIASKTEGLT